VHSVDLVALRECFPNIFECFETMSDWTILAALEATQMDEDKAIRNLKAKLKVRSIRDLEFSSSHPTPPGRVPPCPPCSCVCRLLLLASSHAGRQGFGRGFRGS
jgi:hypothetical protein